MLNYFLNSSILNSWFSHVVILLSSLLAIPIVITTLTVEEINVWFLFATVVAMSQGVLFGFNRTFTRFIAYSYAGIKIEEFRNLRHKKNNSYSQKIDDNEFSRIFFLMKHVYVFLASLYLLVLILFGFIVLDKPISVLTYPNNGWLGWLIIISTTTVTLVFGYYQVLLEGVNKVALVQRVRGIINLIGLPIILGVLFLSPTLVSIVFVYQFVAVSTSFTIIYFGIREVKKLGVLNNHNGFDKSLFSVVWESAWKSGITTILANFVKHFSAILVSQLFLPAQSATFLFTKRIFDVIENFTVTTFKARVPVLAKYRGRGEYETFIPFLRQTQYLTYGVFLIGYSILLFFGDDVLSTIGSNVELGDFKLIMLFSLATFLARWAGMTAVVGHMSNYVIDHLHLMITFIVYFLVIFNFQSSLGIHVFPFAVLCGYILSSPILIKKMYTTMHTTFFMYEKKVMLPMLALLILINFIYSSMIQG